MIKVEHSVVIEQPIDEVFAFLKNFENEPQWQSGMLEAKQSPEGLAFVGTMVRQVRQFLGRRLDYTGEVTEYEENRKIRLKSIAGPYPLQGGYMLEPAQGGTKVTLLLEVQPSGFLRFAQSMVAKEIKKQLEADSSRLKDILQAYRAGN